VRQVLNRIFGQFHSALLSLLPHLEIK